ncbi:uncharacterized protein LOC132619370 [Lycium barbarum]|uniref:uncharacterized protein LOC132619370 n=1 Tax=Lycium barbarum TaxID=112863 RepID=UPI00293F54D9|nr:uncharacterized protein LOC132619370 [Lycium barbarum]
MNWLMWNVKGMNKPFRPKELRNYLNKHKINLAGILETKAADIVITIEEVHAQYIHAKVNDRATNFHSYLTLVYGKNTNEERKSLWERLLRLGRNITEPWCICGDYNTPLSCTDRIGGQGVAAHETRDLQHVVDTLNLANMKASGRLYTWSNGHIWSTIDRALYNDAWAIQHGHLTAQFRENSFSDHSPIHIEHHGLTGGAKRPFRFLNILADHEEFLHTVGAIWDTQLQRNAMYKVWKKLKLCKELLKKLMHNHMRNIDMRVQEARERLQIIQTQVTQTVQHGVDPKLVQLEKNALADLQRWSELQEKTLKQKSKAHYISSRDGNNRNFFTCMKARSSFNSISVLKDGAGRTLVKHEEIENKILKFYKALLGTQADHLPAIDEFFQENKLLRAVNNTVVTLIPKTSQPETVRDFRLIACCSTINKIISKVISNRIRWVIDGPVGPNQSAFIPGRVISDNILLSHELVKGYTRKHISPRCMIKVNIQKDYDSVEWCFIQQILTELGFPEQMVRWIMLCVQTVSYSFQINGILLDNMLDRRGLRQGDPMSPYLFVLLMEYLNRCLGTLKEEPDFNYHLRCQRLGITHLCFADDLLMFTRGDIGSVQLLRDKFDMFSEASGLKANMQKSQVYFAGVDNDTKDAIISVLGYEISELPFKYLGVPLSTKKLTVAQCQPLVDKITARITSWMAKRLSYAGRVQMIRSVLFGIQAYWSQLFLLPQKVIKIIEATCRSYLWTGEATISKRALVAWEKVCLPKDAGGLNFINLKASWMIRKIFHMRKFWPVLTSNQKLLSRGTPGQNTYQRSAIEMGGLAEDIELIGLATQYFSMGIGMAMGTATQQVEEGKKYVTKGLFCRRGV